MWSSDTYQYGILQALTIISPEGNKMGSKLHQKNHAIYGHFSQMSEGSMLYWYFVGNHQYSLRREET